MKFSTLHKLQTLHRLIYIATANILSASKNADGSTDAVAVLAVFDWYAPEIKGLEHYIDLVDDDELHDLFETEYNSFETLKVLTEEESKDRVVISQTVGDLIKSIRKLEELFGE
ncbi:hypothetical protein ODV21_09755 [Lactobacillus amylovorus]|uniref:hypothetical protein n=1 Tax=Lactobacillus amylovorus TaxID=1604 RepID=UPI00232BD812|nr:hypothetical protein [Lactobacillus amylovorus]MDB6243852.1 hypothetical protein [Lactobacillus amylovorus]